MIKKFFINATLFLMILFVYQTVFSQVIDVKIKLGASEVSAIHIEGKFLANNELIEKKWSFTDSYADAENLGKRISDLHLFDEKGNEISYKKFADSEYVADGKAIAFSYKIDVKPLDNTIANAHISWLLESHGLLMLNDLLPKFSGDKAAIKLTFELPENYKVAANEEKIEGSVFLVKDLEKAVFLVGKNFREQEVLVNKTSLNFVILGEWQFKDKLAFEMAEEILKEYADLFGEIPFQKAQIFLLPFPKNIGLNRWRAETRGANVTILSSPMLAVNLAEQRLHEQLRHEIFHLWIPNSLNLSGDYAWFYEGFAVYQALKTGVWLGQIGFDDYLNTLEQAYFLEQKRTANGSLIDSSKMRWNGEVSSVYAKGLLVAFLCDAALLQNSKGKKDLKIIFREIYQTHGKMSKKKDANLSVLKVLRQYRELTPIIEKYIEGTEKIDWTNYLSVFGIENVGKGTNADLKIKSKPSNREKALLKKLGYNRRRNVKKQKIERNVN